MKVIIDAFAWMKKGDLEPAKLDRIREAMTLQPNVLPQYAEEDNSAPLPLFVENEHWIGVAREYFLARRRADHDIEYRFSPGDKSTWPGDLQWNPAIQLRQQQQEASDAVVGAFQSGERLGGMVEGKPGFGKTITGLHIAARLQVPTLVVVHKEFLADQWLERIHGNPAKKIPGVLPGAKVGLAQEDTCDYRGKHIVIGMVHSLAKRPYPKAFYSWPGLVMVDEVHRIGARTWSPVPAKFRARWRLGVTATARRKDGCERVFWDHIGATLYTATEKRLAFKVRRVWTNCQPPRGDRVNTGLAGRAMLLTFLCANLQRNTQIVKQLIEALRAGRKVIVLSERLDHLDKLRELYEAMWLPGDGPLPSIGRYVGGMTREEREQSEKKRVVFATYQYASEGLDVPPLDTAFLASPYSDVEQTVGRIQRPYEGKKEPVVVDFRDDDIAPFKRSGEDRDAFYRKEGALSRS